MQGVVHGASARTGTIGGARPALAHTRPLLVLVLLAAAFHTGGLAGAMAPAEVHGLLGPTGRVLGAWTALSLPTAITCGVAVRRLRGPGDA